VSLVLKYRLLDCPPPSCYYPYALRHKYIGKNCRGYK